MIAYSISSTSRHHRPEHQSLLPPCLIRQLHSYVHLAEFGESCARCIQAVVADAAGVSCANDVFSIAASMILLPLMIDVVQMMISRRPMRKADCMSALTKLNQGVLEQNKKIGDYHIATTYLLPV